MLGANKVKCAVHWKWMIPKHLSCLFDPTRAPKIDHSHYCQFYDRVLPVVPGICRMDVAFESTGRELDLRQRGATLNVRLGNFVSRDFYIENSWKLIDGPGRRKTLTNRSDLNCTIRKGPEVMPRPFSDCPDSRQTVAQ